ncbi:MAG: hypothetical protein NTZ39_00800 [Methanoregula sp.]|nr:hypothetical protein [Methanoregula sp.]
MSWLTSGCTVDPTSPAPKPSLVCPTYTEPSAEAPLVTINVVHAETGRHIISSTKRTTAPVYIFFCTIQRQLGGTLITRPIFCLCRTSDTILR